MRHITLKKKINLKWSPPKKTSLINNLIKIIFIYSVKKIKEKLKELYSVLNPDTNSDSPSEKSNGERLVSAKTQENNIKNKGYPKKINQFKFCA